MDTYYPYGVEPNPPADANHYKFTGKERDAETGNDYFGARYYGSTMGRFVSPDYSSIPEAMPYADLSNSQSFNRYVYLNDNPLSGVDADGHCGAGDPPSLTWEGGTTLDEVPKPCSNLQPPIDPTQGENYSVAGFELSGSATDMALVHSNAVESREQGEEDQLDQYGAPNNGEPPSTCLADNIAAVNQVSNLNVNMNNVVGQPFIYNGGLDVNFSAPGGSPSQLPAGRYPSSFLNSLFGIGSSLHVPGPGGRDPSTYGMSNGNFTFTTHIDSAYSTWHTPLGALIHYFVDFRDKGAHRGPC